MLLWSEVQYCYGTLVFKTCLVTASTAPFSWFSGVQMRQSFEQSSTTKSITWPLVIVEPLNVRKPDYPMILPWCFLGFTWRYREICIHPGTRGKERPLKRWLMWLFKTWEILHLFSRVLQSTKHHHIIIQWIQSPWSLHWILIFSS